MTLKKVTGLPTFHFSTNPFYVPTQCVFIVKAFRIFMHKNKKPTRTIFFLDDLNRNCLKNDILKNLKKTTYKQQHPITYFYDENSLSRIIKYGALLKNEKLATL
jgi:hypothetical protein